MALPLSDEDRARYEKFIREHEPYSEDAQEVNSWDGECDEDRATATLLKALLEGKIK